MNRYKEISRLTSHHSMMWLLALLLCMAMPFSAFSQKLHSEIVSSCNAVNDQDYDGKPTTAAKVVIVTKELDFTIPAVPEATFGPESGELIIFDTDGEPHVIATQKNEGESIFPMIVEDAEGNKYQIDVPPSDESVAPGADGDNGTSSGGVQKPVITPIKDASSGFNKKSLSDKFEDVITFNTSFRAISRDSSTLMSHTGWN